MLLFSLIFFSLTFSIFLLGRRFVLTPSATVDAASTPIDAGPFLGDFTSPLASVLPTSSAKRIQFAKDLVASGDHRKNAVDDFLAKRNAGVLAAIVISAVIFALGLADGRELVVAIILGVVCLFAYSLPRIMLSGRATRRTRAIEKSIPDVMDMIAMSIRGGLPLATAIGQVANRMQDIYPDLAKELGIVFRQTQSGAPDHAYNGFANRIDIPEVVAWCAMMRQSQKLGGGLAPALGDYASRIRVDRQSKAERVGNTASLKLLFPVVLCLAPPIAILLIGPAVIELRDFINREKGATIAAFEEVEQVQP
ncbi:type II secretion system F family protein [Planctomycetes bacterium K23_9]|uniref:Bacterial type II secretion system protein F domain protein n=1 Tax=Stieleria marina TaxID=1930275 RepID=A0A517NYZ8_9BACT|nr:Bacterial type II secretion system protein F domain protein [Planctomycetes bacterium K23_9]